jgi:AcrR family transcriptional regulator
MNLTEALARRAVDRAVGDRQTEYESEIRRIVDSTYDLVARTGTLDPSLRDILKETGLSTQAFYRFFQSKDELLLLILVDGRRQLASYLSHRMERATTPAARLRAWVEGVLAQAKRPDAAVRTRPFVVGEGRLAEAFPDEHQVSVDLFVEQLTEVIADSRRKRAETRRDAQAVYDLVFGALHRHLLQSTTPSPTEIEHLATFAVRAVGLAKERE